MSRFDVYDDYDPLVHGRWMARLKKAVKGRRARQFFAKVIRALEQQKDHRLIEGALRDREGGVCALGSVLYQERRDAGMTPQEAWKSLRQRPRYGWDNDGTEYPYEVADRFKDELDATATLVEELQYQNDEVHFHISPEGRYHSVLQWARERYRQAISS